MNVKNAKAVGRVVLVTSLAISPLATGRIFAETRPVVGAERWVCEFTKTSENWGGTYANVIVHKKVFLEYNPFVDRDTPVWKRTKMPFGPRCSDAEERRRQIFEKRGTSWYYPGATVAAYTVVAPSSPPVPAARPLAGPQAAPRRATPQAVWSMPISALGGFDTYVRSSLPQESWVAEKTLIVGGWGDNYQTIVRFDPGDIHARAKGRAVYLKLFAQQPTDGTAFRPTSFSIYRLTSAVSVEPSWASRPRYDVNTRLQVDVPVLGWNYIDISALLRDWSSGQSNFGLILVPDRTDNKFSVFVSSDDAANSPKSPTIIIAP